MKNILKRNRQELILLLIILAVGGIIGGINPVFFSTPNLLDILSNMVIDGIFAFAVMLGIIIGGMYPSPPLPSPPCILQREWQWVRIIRARWCCSFSCL